MSLGLSLRTGQEINLSEASGENHISLETVYDKWWYVIQPNSAKTLVAYCNATVCSDILCPEFKTRMEINGLSLILKKVQLADKGLRLQCKILQKNKPLPLFYNVMVKNVSVNPTTGQSLFFPLRVWISPLHLIRCLYSLRVTLLPITHMRITSFSLFFYPDYSLIIIIIITVIIVIIIIIIIIDGLVSEFL